MNSSTLRLSLVITLLGAALAASAQNLIVNGGFENPVVGNGNLGIYSGGSTAITGWTVTGTDVLILDTNYGEPGNGIARFASQEGVQSLDITGSANTGLADGVRQTISTAMGMTYRVSFSVGRAQSSVNSSLYNSPSTVRLSIGGGPLTSYTNSNSTSGTTNWQSFTTSFVATGTSTDVAFLNGTPDNSFAGLDNVSVQAVPEPASLAALGLGAAALLRRRKK